MNCLVCGKPTKKGSIKGHKYLNGASVSVHRKCAGKFIFKEGANTVMIYAIIRKDIKNNSIST